MLRRRQKRRPFSFAASKSVWLEMGNFPNFGDFEGPIGKFFDGEFPIHLMGNFALSRFYSKFYGNSYILGVEREPM